MPSLGRRSRACVRYALLADRPGAAAARSGRAPALIVLARARLLRSRCCQPAWPGGGRRAHVARREADYDRGRGWRQLDDLCAAPMCPKGAARVGFALSAFVSLSLRVCVRCESSCVCGRSYVVHFTFLARLRCILYSTRPAAAQHCRALHDGTDVAQNRANRRVPPLSKSRPTRGAPDGRVTYATRRADASHAGEDVTTRCPHVHAEPSHPASTS